MAFLVDTSTLGRLANRADKSHETAKRAVATLHRRGETLHITPQNLVEFRSMAARPLMITGLGLTVKEMELLATSFESAFSMLDETPDIFPAWKGLVTALGIVGKQVHDARLVAVCHVHRVTHVLTFNTTHFARLAGHGPGIVVVDPATV